MLKQLGGSILSVNACLSISLSVCLWQVYFSTAILMFFLTLVMLALSSWALITEVEVMVTSHGLSWVNTVSSFN